MFSIKQTHLKTLVLTALLVTPFFGSAHAAIIDFGLLTGTQNCGNSSNPGLVWVTNCRNYSQVLQSYGDVAGELDVTYADVHEQQTNNNTASLKNWGIGYGNLSGALWSGRGDHTGASHARVFLIPEAGFQVALNSLTFGSYSGFRSSNISVLDAVTSSTLLDLGEPTINGHTRSEFSTLLGPSSNGYIIDWYDTAYNVGLGAINYTTSMVGPIPPNPVSEPGLLALLAAGSIGLIASRRRKQRS